MQTTTKKTGMKLGINGFGRIGKLTVWNQIGRQYFDELVVNIGRDAGTSMEDIAHYVERDSTYGSLHGFLHGFQARPAISDINEQNSSMVIDGIKVQFLKTDRNPSNIAWRDNGVRLVVDTTGQFLDPTLPPDAPKGAARGHLEAGAEKLIVSAPFKIKDQGNPMPEDAVTTVMGINGDDYDPRKHRIISNASCTTNCLAHMIKPILNVFGAKKILTASMSTIHAVTGSQEVLDRLPKSGKTDLRKNRSVINNIILTSTGAAKALRLVIPEMGQIGFIAESVRVMTTTGSLIILILNLQDDIAGEGIRRETINEIYRQAAENDPRGYLMFTEKQNVSSDIIGMPKAAAIIEGHETHTRTANVSIDMEKLSCASDQPVLDIPITQSVIYGWYDNEMGSYVNMLSDRTISVAESIR